jgi:hypothetical protein
MGRTRGNPSSNQYPSSDAVARANNASVTHCCSYALKVICGPAVDLRRRSLPSSDLNVGTSSSASRDFIQPKVSHSRALAPPRAITNRALTTFCLHYRYLIGSLAPQPNPAQCQSDRPARAPFVCRLALPLSAHPSSILSPLHARLREFAAHPICPESPRPISPRHLPRVAGPHG